MNARVEHRDGGAFWDVFFDGWRTAFLTERYARLVAARFDAGEVTPLNYASTRVLPYGPEFQDQDAHAAGRPAPHTSPIRTADDAMVAAMVRTGLDLVSAFDAVVEAAKELWNLSLAGVDMDSDVWLDAQGRLFDRVSQLPVDVVPTHDEQCEADYMFPAGGWTTCGCEGRS